nr:hypothetical protein [Pseudomonas sp. RGM 3321]
MNQSDRSAKTAARRKTRGEEELRMHAMEGTRTALAELMAWNGIEEQGEAMTLMIHHIHGLGREGSARFLAAPRHKYVIPENVSAKLQIAYNREALRICHNE